MGVLEAIIIGIIQGLTEFLPVSSSGHIELSKAILNVEVEGEENVMFTVVLHAATALSTIIIFRKDILQIILGLFQFKWNEDFKFAIKILISMFPAAFVGIVFNDVIDSFFNEQILLVGLMLVITGLLLFLADRAKDTTKSVGFLNAFIIGISQAIAILPGISRSGSTIATAVLLGIDKAKAARFSFLMVVPLILGKMAKELMDAGLATYKTEELTSYGSEFIAAFYKPEELIAYGSGFIAAFIVGLFACSWMISLVKKSQLKYFSFYCFIVGTLAIVHAAI